MSEATELKKAIGGPKGISVLKFTGSDVGFFAVSDDWVAGMGEDQAVEHLGQVLKSHRPADGTERALEPA